MKEEFKEAVEYLEEWYDWRDKRVYYRIENNSWVQHRSGWRGHTHVPGENWTNIARQTDYYREDCFQLEEAHKGNSTCEYEFEGKCICYGWPGYISTQPWTERDDANWLAGQYYTECDSVFQTSATRDHLRTLYGYDPYRMNEEPNDVVAVIEEGDNATQEEVRDTAATPDAGRLHNQAETGSADADNRSDAEAGQALAGTASSISK